MVVGKVHRLLSVFAPHSPLQSVSIYLLAPVLTIVLSVALVYIQSRVLAPWPTDLKSSGHIKRRLPEPPKPPIAMERNLNSALRAGH